MLSLNPGNLDTWAAALATAAIEDRDVDSILKQAFTSPSSSSSSRGGEDGPASVGDFVDERPTSEKILPISGGCSKYDRPDGMSSLSTLQHSENLSQATDSANEWIVVSNNKEPPSSATSDCQLIPVKKQQKSSTKIKTFLSSKKFKIATSVAAGALGVVGAITAAPIVVAGLGFTSAGIAAGSTAAAMMSALGGGATAAGSTVAILQSVGATGAVLGSVAATGVATAVGGAVGAGVGVGVNAGIDAVIGDKSSDDDTVGSTETN